MLLSSHTLTYGASILARCETTKEEEFTGACCLYLRWSTFILTRLSCWEVVVFFTHYYPSGRGDLLSVAVWLKKKERKANLVGNLLSMRRGSVIYTHVPYRTGIGSMKGAGKNTNPLLKAKEVLQAWTTDVYWLFLCRLCVQVLFCRKWVLKSCWCKRWATHWRGLQSVPCHLSARSPAWTRRKGM